MALSAHEGLKGTIVTIRINSDDSYWKVRIWTSPTTRHIYRISPETAQTVEAALICARRQHGDRVPKSPILDIQVAIQRMGEIGHTVVMG